MASISSYPHIEMHVRDDSIYIPYAEEILPLNKPLYIMKTQRGPVGVPTWCATYSDAVRVFGADTFNKRSPFYSESAYFLMKTFPFNGAFIMRVTSEEAVDAHVSIEIGLSKANSDDTLPEIVPQYKRDVNGNFELELSGAKIPIDKDGKGLDEYSEDEKESFVQAYLPGYKIAWRATVRSDLKRRPIGTVSTETSENFVWYPLVDVVATNPGEWGSAYGIKMFYDHMRNTIAGTISNGSMTVSLTPVEILQDATVPTEVVDAYGQSCVDGVIKPNVVDSETGIDLELGKRVKQAYSGKQALPLTFTYINDNWNVVGKKLALAELNIRESALKLYPFLDKVVVESLDNGFVTTEDETPVSGKAYYFKTGTGPDTDPANFTRCTKSDFRVDGSFKVIVFKKDSDYWEKSSGTFVKTSDSEPVDGKEYFFKIGPAMEPDSFVQCTMSDFDKAPAYWERNIIAVEGVKVFLDDLFSKTASASDIGGEAFDTGYMVNIISTMSEEGVPYFASCIIDSTDDIVQEDSRVNIKDVITPSSDTMIRLGGGWDGGVDGIPYDWEVEEYIRAHIHSAIAGTHDYLNDYWRCPFNAIYDTGVSIKTKKMLMDFESVRDNIVVNISTQVTWKKNKEDINDPVPNARMDDESIAASLRAYALLQREDVVNGTGACRTKIFCHAGKTSDHDDKWLPYTLWIALKNAEYLNKQYIWQEPKELPYSAVECFTETSWTAAQEETKSRVWNMGVNYVQYYDMTSIHFASVRSVYWYETSVLVDAGCVDALCFMKDIARRSWSTWAGSTRKAAELNQLITDDLNARNSYMLHNKFRHKVNVYQTDEDMNLGFQRHVDLELWAAGQNRVWKTTIICKREGFNDRENNGAAQSAHWTANT